MLLFNSPKNRKQGFKLALFAVGFAVIVVILGAFTRLVDAGLGCPDWPGCYGHLTWPDETHEITRAEELFPDSPVEAGKAWPEMVHRYFAGTLGLLIVTLAWLAWRNREQEGYPFRLPLLLLFLVVWQAMFGMWTVTLKLWPQVVTMHLLGGMAVFSLLWLLCLRLDDTRWQLSAASLESLQRFKPWLIGGLVVVVVQILLGGWTTANYAAFACYGFPACHGAWVPEMDFQQGFNVLQRIGPNYLGGALESEARTAIHYTHRIGALVTTVYILGLIIALFAAVKDYLVRRMGIFLLLALGLQIGLGIGNVLFMVPLSIAVLHNASAGLLLATLVTLCTRVWMAREAS